jgi:epsilon-lactone hydrolase
MSVACEIYAIIPISERRMIIFACILDFSVNLHYDKKFKMPSIQAAELNEIFRKIPKQVNLDLKSQREAGEHQEDLMSDPAGVIWEDATGIDGLWIRPANIKTNSVILYIYGGGFVISSPHSRKKFGGRLTLSCKSDVLIPKYRLAPENPFPSGLKDVVAAYKFLLAEGYPAKRIVIAGDSSGGGLTLSLLIALKQEGLPAPGGAIAISPWADLACAGQSLAEQPSRDLTVTKASLQRMANQYLNGQDPYAPLASPLYADLTGLPPVFVIVGGDEALLDDSLRYVRSAAIAGVDIQLLVGAGMQHIYPVYAGFMPESDKAVADIGKWVCSLFEIF